VATPLVDEAELVYSELPVVDPSRRLSDIVVLVAAFVGGAI
jgi:hypothetical protein